LLSPQPIHSEFFSLLTENERPRLIYAIQEVSGGGCIKMVGGHRVLFHFGCNYGNGDSSVVGVGVSLLLVCDGMRRSTLDCFSNGCMDVWNHQGYKGLNSFGEHAVDIIAEDAALLKRLEMVWQQKPCRACF
jgi:hypothetical protein